MLFLDDYQRVVSNYIRLSQPKEKSHMQENFEKVLNNSLNPVNKKIIELIEFKET
jgi:flagellar hook-basal body complex protein FliE